MNIREPYRSAAADRTINRLSYSFTLTVALVGLGVGLTVVIPLFGTVVSSHGLSGGDVITAPGIYAATSALLAALALGVVSASLALQRTNQRREVSRELDRTLADLRNQIREHPEYGQCWGARISPRHVPEHVFIYTARIIDYWAASWRQGEIDDAKAARFAQEFFKSEVPRMYWERFGSWHKRRPSARRFINILDEEFLHAIKEGPPERPYEPCRDAERDPAQPERTSEQE